MTHGNKRIHKALISVFHKEGLEDIINTLKKLKVDIYSTGGTYDYIQSLSVVPKKIEELTSYPSILGGRVKTLHPKVFGGILGRRNMEKDLDEMNSYEIPAFDLVIVDLYPFEETLKNTTEEKQIIEKIDIGGISLIRAAAKNYQDVLVVSSQSQYEDVNKLLEQKNGETSRADRKAFAAKAFAISSHYDTAIFNYFNEDEDLNLLRISNNDIATLRYGENPHQKGFFYGNLEEMFTQLHGKAISYNNLLDLDAAISLINDFEETTFAILKHTNACGVASRDCLVEAWKDALAGDPVSAFGGVLVTNKVIDEETAIEMNKIFFEIVIAPGYDDNALKILKKKKNRIILLLKENKLPTKQYRSILNGTLVQDRDTKIEKKSDLKVVTDNKPSENQVEDIIFANKLVKHSKSNAIVLAKGKQLLASGVGQTSRVDALKQAIEKANHFNFDLKDAIMASDAFFPFADSVEIANKAGVSVVIQPGGSIRDKDSIDYCNEHKAAMIFTGNRHFKH